MDSHTATKISVRDCGIAVMRGGAGRPLVILHGASGAGSWLSYMADLALRHDVIVPEHPGFGGSDTPGWLDTIPDLANFYLDFLDRLDLNDVDLVGFSLGGWIAAELAARNTRRLASLTLVAAAGIHVKGVEQVDPFLLGDEQRIETGKKTMIWSLAGLAIALFAHDFVFIFLDQESFLDAPFVIGSGGVRSAAALGAAGALAEHGIRPELIVGCSSGALMGATLALGVVNSGIPFLSFAMAARILRRHAENPERLFVAGLLHELGALLIYTQRPDEARAAIERSRETGVPLHAAERELLGLDHAEVGAALLQQDHRLVAEIAAAATVLFRQADAQQAVGTGVAPGVRAHQAGLAKLGRARHPAIVHEASHAVLQHAVLLGHPDRREKGQ